MPVNLCVILCLMLALTFAAVTPALAQRENVEVDVSTRSVAITSSFTGTEILVFGTVENSRQPSAEAGTYDVVVVVEGTRLPATVRKKTNVGGLWINTQSVRFATFPSYYAIASTRPLEEVADLDVRNRLEIGFAHIRLLPAGGTRTTPSDADEMNAFKEAIVRLKQDERLYIKADYGVSFIGRSLFRSTISLPPNVPIGPLITRTYLFRDGALLGESKNEVMLERAGIERFLHDAARGHAVLYGIATVLLAVAAGLGAAFAFRRVAL
ncbi:MAG: TIGR02186 family protein [Hyphomicrobium sp.]